MKDKTIDDVVDKVISLVSDYFEALGSDPTESEVRYGCDCGCGGDDYSEEEWDELTDAPINTREELFIYIKKLMAETH